MYVPVFLCLKQAQGQEGYVLRLYGFPEASIGITDRITDILSCRFCDYPLALRFSRSDSGASFSRIASGPWDKSISFIKANKFSIESVS